MREISITKEISSSVLVARINRKLETESQNQKKCRMDESPSFGHFYAHSEPIPERTDPIDIESIGRELGVLKDSETVKE